jgi:hypothetical protein
MASKEFSPTTHFIEDKPGADGVGGYIPYGLRLEEGFFVDEDGARYEPSLLSCPEHAEAVASNESKTAPLHSSDHPAAPAEAPLVNR